MPATPSSFDPFYFCKAGTIRRAEVMQYIYMINKMLLLHFVTNKPDPVLVINLK